MSSILKELRDQVYRDFFDSVIDVDLKLMYIDICVPF